jgi:microsomal dipeptidase-like Zn-dependent dipeptidase
MTKRRSPFVSLALAVLLVTPFLASAPGRAADTRLQRPQNRYAMAGGCYNVESIATGKPIGRSDGSFVLGGAAEPFHFQATDLGHYLLFGSKSDFLAVNESAPGEAVKSANAALPGQVTSLGTDTLSEAVADAVAPAGRGTSIVAAPTASKLGDWVINQAAPNAFTFYLPATDESLVATGGQLALASGKPAGRSARFGFMLTMGCARWPEVEVNVRGAPFVSKNLTDEVLGYDDAHNHTMSFEFLGGRVICGRPWHPYGVTFALVDCPDHGQHGETAVLEMVLSGGDPATGHSPEGWPSFEGWPRPESLTHQQIYYKWLERAWRGGLRLMTTLLVENHALCTAYPYKRNSCNEMDAVRLQAGDMRKLERYIDAQNGGPGKGWLRIVTDPFQARQVIAEGKLAVILGIEVSTPFDCGIKRDVPQCSEALIDQQLDQVYKLGVRQMELTNKFDNGMTGVTGDNGSTGAIVNVGNLSETGQFWRMVTCPKSMGARHDNAQYNLHDEAGTPPELTGNDSIIAGVAEVSGMSGVAPIYPPGPHCNVLGLTKLGEYAVRGLIKRGMIFDPDHMSALARMQAMKILREMGYSGSVSSHSWSDEPTYQDVYNDGGVVTPITTSSQSFINTWQKRRAEADPRFYFGLGYGADVGGFHAQPPARRVADAAGVSYPFVGLGGVVIDKAHSGTKVWDVNSDGVAQYGLYPDWIQDMRVLANKEKPGEGDLLFHDMARSAEAYLQMWERALGVRGDACRADVADLTASQFSSIDNGMTWVKVLHSLGQPKSRQNGEYHYCLTGGRSGIVSFDQRGNVTGTSIG